MSKEPINYGDLDPQQRLDVARGEKLGADGLEVVAAAKALCKHHAELCGVNSDDQWTHYSEDFLADVQIVAPYLQADAQRLLPQRDAEVERLNRLVDHWKNLAVANRNVADAALESQQAASVGREREAFEDWIKRDAGDHAAKRWPTDNGPGYANDRVQDYRTGWVECLNWQKRAALSPTGGGVVDLVFSGELPNAVFVEAEDGNGRSVSVGEWFKREDGYWVLRLNAPAGGGVILPERKTCDDGYPSDDWLEANTWNRALDAVARLNAKPQANSQEAE